MYVYCSPAEGQVNIRCIALHALFPVQDRAHDPSDPEERPGGTCDLPDSPSSPVLVKLQLATEGPRFPHAGYCCV